MPLSLTQNAPSAACPAIRIAARSLIATPKTLERPAVTILSRSPSVSASRFRGETGRSPAVGPTRWALGFGDAINLLSRRAVDPAVVDDAIGRRVRAGQLNGVARGRRCHAVPMVTVREPGPVPLAAAEDPVFIESRAESFQVLVGELIDADDNHKGRRVARQGRAVRRG